MPKRKRSDDDYDYLRRTKKAAVTAALIEAVSREKQSEEPLPPLVGDPLEDQGGPSTTENAIDSDILEILGADPTQDNLFGKPINKDVAVRFEHCSTNGSVNYAGSLHLFYDQWRKITNDPVILSYIQGYRIPLVQPAIMQHTHFLNNNFSAMENKQIDVSISDLISIGAIARCTACTGHFISSIFLVPKPNGKMRFILNFKNFNKFVDTCHFKLEDVRTALKLISRDSYLAKIDVNERCIFFHTHSSKR